MTRQDCFNDIKFVWLNSFDMHMTFDSPTLPSCYFATDWRGELVYSVRCVKTPIKSRLDDPNNHLNSGVFFVYLTHTNSRKYLTCKARVEDKTSKGHQK